VATFLLTKPRHYVIIPSLVGNIRREKEREKSLVTRTVKRTRVAQNGEDVEALPTATKKPRTVKVTPKVEPVTPEVEPETEIMDDEVEVEEVAEESNAVELPELKRKDVAPRAFRSEMVDLHLIDGFDNGDPPDDDFLADIAANGIEVPPRVRKEGDRYVAEDGRRRLKAAEHLLQAGRKEFARVPVIIDTRKNVRDSRFASLAMNYQRGENIIGDARTVMQLKAEGFTEQQIASRSGLKIETVRALRKIMTDLDPRLIKLVEEGKMKPWAARQAAQKAPEVQARLIALAETKDKITPEDVRDSHRANAVMTANGMDNDELYDGEDFPAEATPLPVSAPVPGGKVSHQTRVENAARYAGLAKQELLAIKSGERTSAEQAALDSFEDAIRLLVNGEDVVADIVAYDAAEEDDDEEEESEKEPDADEIEFDDEEDEEEEVSDEEPEAEEVDDEEPELDEEPPF
jgi:DNA-binding CsgD family transcriptional regulator